MNATEIYARAEEESTRQLQAPAMPPHWDFSDELRARLNHYLEQTKTHADAWSELQDALDDYREAVASDEKNRRTAARAGQKDPGTKATEDAARRLEFAYFRCQEVRQATDAAWPGDLIRAEVKARQAEFARELAERITTATQAYEHAINEARSIVGKAQNRLVQLAGELRWADGHFENVMFGTIQQGFEEIRWPTAYRQTDAWLTKLAYAEATAATPEAVQ